MCPRFRYHLTHYHLRNHFAHLRMTSEQNSLSNEILIESTSPEIQRNPRHTNTFITIKLLLEHSDIYPSLVT